MICSLLPPDGICPANAAIAAIAIEFEFEFEDEFPPVFDGVETLG
jgi:hypothetical protein